LTPISAKTLSNRNLYVLLVYFPGSRTKVAMRRVSRRPFAAMNAGDELRVARRRVRVHSTAHRVEHSMGKVEHITEVFTRPASRKRATRDAAPPANVVQMPLGESSVIAEFLRFHVLVRVYDGDPDAWLAQLHDHPDDHADVRFLRWIRSRLRQDPALMGEIRRMVDATPFWRAAQA
jgi:hypothetical protein